MGKSLKGKELGVGISQQKDGYYSGRVVDYSGRRIQKRFKKLQECKAWTVKMQSRTIQNVYEGITVNEWYQKWIAVKIATVKPETVHVYQNRYKFDIKDVIGKMKLVGVKPIHCQDVFLKMIEKGRAKGTVNSTYIVLQSLFDAAIDNDIISRNPCKKIKERKMGRQTDKKEAVTISTQKRFLEAATGTLYEREYRFVLQTGLRVGELIGLRWSDVDLENREIRIVRSIYFNTSEKVWHIGAPKSEYGKRRIPLTDEAIRILKEQKEFDEKLKIPEEWKDQVFLSRKGKPVYASQYDRCMETICQRAGVKTFRIHVLRHTFATRCIEGKMSPKTLQKILGHHDVAFTLNTYVTTTADEMKKEMKSVENTLMVQ